MNILERLKKIDDIPLGGGKHAGIDDGLCVMEAAAYVAGEHFSDRPQCVCPVIANFCRTWNDMLPTDEDRDRLLRPLIPRLLYTRADKRVELERSYLALDWLIRMHLPAWLDLTESLRPHAAALRALPELKLGVCWTPEQWRQLVAALDAALCAARSAALYAARDAARAAARDAARDAALYATRDAALYAARVAARDAALYAARYAVRDAALYAARDAALYAALYAARDAARGAALYATRDALSETVSSLWMSALDLVERMIKVEADE